MKFKATDAGVKGLTLGKVYEGKVDPTDPGWVDLIANDQGNVQSYYSWRFEVVEADEPVLANPKLAEADPNGVAANAPGSKLDAGKARPALVLGEFPRALAAVVDIGTFGANKYTPRGWLSVPNGQERYADAAFRHQLKVWAGEKVDDGVGGTGGLHKAQVIWNLLAELELELRGAE